MVMVHCRLTDLSQWGRAEQDREVGRSDLGRGWWQQCLTNPNPLHGPDPLTWDHVDLCLLFAGLGLNRPIQVLKACNERSPGLPPSPCKMLHALWWFNSIGGGERIGLGRQPSSLPTLFWEGAPLKPMGRPSELTYIGMHCDLQTGRSPLLLQVRSS